ncbi:unnamed protein product [Urochloa humidicola]
MAAAGRARAASTSVERVIPDLYEEILLRLPADQPRLLFRFRLVSKGWSRVLTDPGFLGRYRSFHGAPPMVGYFHDVNTTERFQLARFVATTNLPFSSRLPDDGVGLHVLDSRHGRALFLKEEEEDTRLVVWDPVAGRHEELRLPEEHPCNSFFGATILCNAADCHHRSCHGGPFRLVFVGVDNDNITSAYVYSSATGAWTPSTAAAVAAAADDWGFNKSPTTFIGNAVYFRTSGRILQYAIGAEADHMTYLDVPQFASRGSELMPAAEGRLMFAAMYGRHDTSIRFWETDVRDGGVVDWVLLAVVTTPLPRGLLIGSAGVLLFIRTEDGGVMSFNVANGRYQELPRPADTCKPSILVPFLSFGIDGRAAGEAKGKKVMRRA